MPRRYDAAMYRDRVGDLLQHQQLDPRGGNGVGGRRQKAETPAKNYRMANKANIKEIQALNRQKREEEAAPPAEPFKLKQFKNVPSKILSNPAMQGSSSPPWSGSSETPAPTHQFLKKGSREKSTPWRGAREIDRNDGYNDNRGGGARSVMWRKEVLKEAVPKASDVARLAPRSTRDFVLENRMKAVEMKARAASDQDKTFTHESYGRVPGYLLSRQEDWEREAERLKAEAPDPLCPPGMKLMSEEERLNTLMELQEREAICQAQLNKFPLVVQTPLLQRRVDDLNERLKEIDAAITRFSRPRVYIAQDG